MTIPYRNIYEQGLDMGTVSCVCIPNYWKLRQDYHRFKASLSYIERLS